MTIDDRPLAKLVVLDFSRYLPAQICTWMLADFGAQIIRLENPREIQKLDAAFGLGALDAKERAARKARESLARNKRSLVIDIGHPMAKPIIHRLARRANAVTEDYRPGVLESLGFGAAEMRKVNPRINYCSVSYGGQQGPNRNHPGHDQMALAVSGILSRIGEDATNPAFPNVPIVDITAGLQAAFGLLLAHLTSESTGLGQEVDISLLDAAAPYLAWFLSRHPDRDSTPARGAHRIDFGIWQTSDGKHLCTTNIEPKYWERFCHAIGCPQYVALQHDREQWPVMRESIAQTIASKSLQEWLQVFERANVQAAHVNEFFDALNEPQYRVRGLISDVAIDGQEVVAIGNPVRLSETPSSIRSLGEIPGASTTSILGEAGYSAEEMRALLDEGVVRTNP